MMVLATSAYAKPRSFGSFKLVSQVPAIHNNRTLHERTQPLGADIAACGPLPGGLHPSIKLHVAADGSISDVELPKSHLPDDMAACIRKVLTTLTYPAQKQPSVLTWVLVYNH